MATFKQVPPMSANFGQACYQCFAEQTPEKQLSRCGACKRIGYCSTACQKKNWKEHKTLCKALGELETTGSGMSLHFYNLSDPTAGDSINTMELTEFTNMSIHADIYFVERALGRPLDMIERNLFAWEPRCAACGINERMLRIRAREQGQGSSTQLQKCGDCLSTFFCSPRHWALVKKTHNTVPAAVNYNGMTLCQINQLIREDIRVANLLREGKAQQGGVSSPDFGPLLPWAPNRTMEGWKSLLETDWEKEFLGGIAEELPFPPGTPMKPFLRAASDNLTLPMTILYALERLYGGDLAFTREEVLVIHVIGAADLEVMNAMMFEEILHRLPEVKRVEILLCGPDMGKIGGSEKPGGVALSMETCPECTEKDRRRVQIMSSSLYHDYVAKAGASFKAPALAVAFNSGASEVETDSWKATMKVLVEKKIPTVFTAFNRGEAEKEAALLKEAGAELVPALGPCRNPWGSMLFKVEPASLEGFYNSNGWFAGGFK
ncbi:hypothetical protein DFP72DRAFT_900491 [Ephemerocybe angulata]|uniref:MYND-type domain-containing protein n=1 Tax=Ephemerocybe angulata TaxID=980116 RepID=A0A8H6HX49_9AGAR|nr:hypothetical protein DFP72DRAFT_900491 [Tulosesus angulatus]